MAALSKSVFASLLLADQDLIHMGLTGPRQKTSYHMLFSMGLPAVGENSLCSLYFPEVVRQGKVVDLPCG